MYPILARYGPFFLFSFTVIMGLGILAGIGLTAVLARGNNKDHANWLDGLLLALVMAIIGGRIAFVWVNWDYYQEHVREISLVWRGGLSYHGAIVAGLITLLAWTLFRRHSFAYLAGLLAPALILGSIFGWLACWFDGCAFGRETGFGLLAADLPDSYGVFALRYQTQWMGLALCLIIFIIVIGLRRRLQPIRVFWLTLFLLSLGRVFVSYFRGDEMPLIGAYRIDTLFDGTLALLSVIALLAAAILGKMATQRGSGFRPRRYNE
jgi:phosphatidylglycerol:prolipoprotein diacylglycerol transferase